MAKKKFGFGDHYCTNCGAPMEKGGTVCPHCSQPYDVQQRCGMINPLGAGGIGWSAQVQHPCFGKAARKNRIASVIFALIVSAVIFAVLFFTGELSADKGGFKIFGIIMAILWTFWIIWMVFKSIPKKDWDGVVEQRSETTEQRVRHNSEGGNEMQYVTKYQTVIRKADGGHKKIVEYDRCIWYGYLFEGEAVRFHGNHMEYYEKYDKSRETKLMCASCNAMRDTRENFCGRCGCILLKGQPVASPAPAPNYPQMQF